MNLTAVLRYLVCAACLPLLWPPGVCPHHGPVALVTGDHTPDDPADCCQECSGADQSRLTEPAVVFALDLGLAVTVPDLPPLPHPVRPAAPPPHPSPPLYLAHCSLNC